ncbi:MAG: serine/threonine protein kinase [Anaerolineales bacterium]
MNTLTGRTLGRYQLLDQIGQGGMATVHKAYDPTQDRHVALKVLSPAMAQQEQFIQRFRREAGVVVQLRHPHIVPVENFGEEDGYAYLVMPYIEGGSLTDQLMHSPPSPTFGARVVEQVASALEHAHGRGVVHRDVKPSNILMDEEGNALLADFGFARIHDASISLTGSALIGTPAYISPEQARGETVDHRSDQYSLGVILFQLATGSLPFEAETPMAVLIKHINEPMPLPRAVSADVPEAVERVILKATAKDPAHRFGSVGELNEVFQAALSHALDPRAPPIPTIELPPSVKRLHQQPTVLMRNQWVRRAAIGASLLFLLLACPVSASGLRGLLDQASSPAESSGLVDPEFSAFQLTALAGTIEAMSTELAAAPGEPISPDEVQTAVIQTLAASDPIVRNAAETEAAQPTATPDRNIGAGPSPSETPAGTDVPAPSATVGGLPTRTPTSPTSTTSTPLTSTPTPGLPATSTSTPTSPSSPIPTQTPTNTPIPPTSSPGATPLGSGDVCSASSLSGFSVSGKNVSWTLNNGGSTTVEITQTVIAWPSGNEELLKVYLGGVLIWDETDGSPPTTLGSDWAGGSRMLNQGEGKPLKFEFDTNAAALGYSLTVTLNGDCELSAGG